MTQEFKNDEESQGSLPEGARQPAGSDAADNRPAPEPPARWRPYENAAQEGQQADYQEQPAFYPNPEPDPRKDAEGVGVIGSVRFKLRNSEITDFQNARRYLTATYAIAVLSLFFGGVIVSGVALVCAFAAYGKLDKLAVTRDDEPEVKKALKRSGILAIVVAAASLALNALAILFLYPVVSQTLQTGDLNSLMGGSSQTTPGSGGSTWG